MRISVTELDHWRLYHEQDWMSYSDFIDGLSGKKVENDKMMAGSAFHKQLEETEQGEEIPNRFTQNEIEFELKFHKKFYMPKIRELKIEKHFTVDGMSVTLVGKTDSLEGKQVWDHKLTESFDVEKYLDSLQWRAYLDMFDCDRFTYNCFEGAKKRSGRVEVDDVHVFSFYRYPGLERDYQDVVYDLARFMRDTLPHRITFGDEKLAVI